MAYGFSPSCGAGLKVCFRRTRPQAVIYKAQHSNAQVRADLVDLEIPGRLGDDTRTSYSRLGSYNQRLEDAGNRTSNPGT